MERLDSSRRQAERLRVEAEQLRQEAERLKAEEAERVRQQAEQQEAERLRLEAERLRQKAEQLEAERRRVEAERLEAEARGMAKLLIIFKSILMECMQGKKLPEDCANEVLGKGSWYQTEIFNKILNTPKNNLLDLVHERNDEIVGFLSNGELGNKIIVQGKKFAPHAEAVLAA